MLGKTKLQRSAQWLLGDKRSGVDGGGGDYVRAAGGILGRKHRLTF